MKCIFGFFSVLASANSAKAPPAMSLG